MMGRKVDFESIHALNHTKCMLSAFQNFRQNETMLDVTLVCDGQKLKAHKLVLASCSEFFKELFSENPCKHPIVILRHSDFEDLKACIDFIYKGELSVPKARLKSALKMAEELNIRGLKPSGTNREKYEKLYNQLCGKPPNRKKRKRNRHNSRESNESNSIEISDSDPMIDKSETDDVTFSESQAMDVELISASENFADEKEVRPLVLHIGDSTSNEGSVSKVDEDEGDSKKDNCVENDLSTSDIPIESASVPNNNQTEIFKTESENLELRSEFDAVATYSENSNLESVSDDSKNNSQDQSMECLAASEDLKEHSLGLSQKSLETQQSEEAKPPDGGKRFVCSKCDSVFTSRINFMRHKALGHNNTENEVHKCQHCTFTTEEMDCLQRHLLLHTDGVVPYKCSTCSQEFISEDVYKTHISLHEVEQLAGLSSVDEQNLLVNQNKDSAENLEFRCSICFIKFNSKLRCQIHEKSCQGGS